MEHPEHLFRITALVWLLALCGCSTTQSYRITERYDPLPNTQVYRVHPNAVISRCIARRQDVRECGRIRSDGTYAGPNAFIEYKRNEWAVIWIRDDLSPEEEACTLNHEYKHSREGDYHGDRPHGGCQ